MKKQTIIFISCLLIAALAVGAALLINHQLSNKQKTPTDDQAQEDEIKNEHTTNIIGYYEGEVPPADPLMVGRWKNLENEKWHKVYYDDDDGEGHYWGKEWDEADDVLEEDLSYHGNGWFRWVKSNDTLYEYSTMDFRDVPIAHIYYITAFDSANIQMAETNKRSTHYFVKE